MSAAHDRIVFSLEQQEQAPDPLEEEREKHKTRSVSPGVVCGGGTSSSGGAIHAVGSSSRSGVALLNIRHMHDTFTTNGS